MTKPFPANPSHPERICWGCDRYCPAKDLACGNGADRTMHPMEVFGEDWDSPGDWGVGVVIATDQVAEDDNAAESQATK